MWGDGDEDDFGFDLGPLMEVGPEAEALAQAMAEAMRTPLSPGDPRRHHYVPQFYLRRFAAGDQIARVQLDEPDRHDLTNVLNVAVIKDFYTIIDEVVGETVSVERLLGAIDGLASGVFDQVATASPFPISRLDRICLSMWISMLHVRGPKTRREMEALADHFMKMQLSLINDEESARAQLRGEDGPEPDPELVQGLLDTARDMDEWEIAPHQNDMVRNMLEAGRDSAPFFMGRLWALARFPEPGLVLTDAPVILYQRPENFSPLLGVGLATADEIWVPLDRSTALILHNDGEVGEVIIDLPAEGIDYLNQGIVSNAFREVYCHPDDLERLGRVELPDPDRPLVHSSGTEFVRGTTDGVNEPPMRKGPHRYRRAEGDAGNPPT